MCACVFHHISRSGPNITKFSPSADPVRGLLDMRRKRNRESRPTVQKGPMIHETSRLIGELQHFRLNQFSWDLSPIHRPLMVRVHRNVRAAKIVFRSTWPYSKHPLDTQIHSISIIKNKSENWWLPGRADCLIKFPIEPACKEP